MTVFTNQKRFITRLTYDKMFTYLVDKRTIDYVVNLEVEYGQEAVVEEARRLGFKE
jgi:hypothetical protein